MKVKSSVGVRGDAGEWFSCVGESTCGWFLLDGSAGELVDRIGVIGVR